MSKHSCKQETKSPVWLKPAERHLVERDGTSWASPGGTARHYGVLGSGCEWRRLA